MNTKIPSITILGMFLFVIGVLKPGLGFQLPGYEGYQTVINLDTVIAVYSIMGIICSIIAVKKNKNPNIAFFTGLFLGPLAMVYYLISKQGMSEKEREIYEWELEKKYKKMTEERK